MRFVCLFILLVLLSCQDPPLPTPKPRMFPRVEYPVKEYKVFDESYCKFGFQQPAYAKVIQEENYFDEKPADPCWFDLNITSLNTSIHCSYYPVNSQKEQEEYVNDAFKLMGKHNVKADYIDELIINNPQGVKGILFELTGPVASPLQFYLTDEKEHFFRGSVYFDSKVNRDSIQPVYEFIKEDVLKMIETFRWND